MRRFIFLFLFLILVPFVYSAPPVTTVSQFPEGYFIEEIPHQILKINTDFIYYFYLYNSSNGVRIDNSSVECSFNMVDSQGVFLLSQNVSYIDSYWTTTINGSYFDEVGSYYYGVDCQDGLGGALAGTFYVTPNGGSYDLGIVIPKLFVPISCLIIMLFFTYLSSLGLNAKEVSGEEKPAIRFLFMGIAFVFLIAHILTTSLIMEELFANSTGLTSAYNSVMYIFFTIIVLIFLFILSKVAFSAVSYIEKQRGLR